jgi:RNA recognition motif-containing protein
MLFYVPLSLGHEEHSTDRKVFARRSLQVGKKLHVGNLTFSATHSNLAQWFAPYGTVRSAQVVQDRETGRSKGFGFVEMDSDAEAQAAIQGLNDQEHDGRRLTVDEAKPREARTTALRGGSGGGQSW